MGKNSNIDGNSIEGEDENNPMPREEVGKKLPSVRFVSKSFWVPRLLPREKPQIAAKKVIDVLIKWARKNVLPKVKPRKSQVTLELHLVLLRLMY